MKKHETTVPNSMHPCAVCSGRATPEHPLPDRREFLTTGAAALAMLALAACGVNDATAPTTLNPTSLKLADYPKLANVGGIVTLSVSGSPVAIVRESATAFSAFSLVCPHQGATVQPQSSSFYCPGHGAQFNLQGQWIGGQRTSSLRSYPVTYDASAGTLTLGG